MTKNNQITESLAFEIEFKKLGDALGDYLMFLELEQTKTIKDQSFLKQTKWLVDCYASKFDRLLSNYRLTMGSEISSLVMSLLTDLEKQKQYRNLVAKHGFSRPPPVTSLTPKS